MRQYACETQHDKIQRGLGIACLGYGRLEGARPHARGRPAPRGPVQRRPCSAGPPDRGGGHDDGARLGRRVARPPPGPAQRRRVANDRPPPQQRREAVRRHRPWLCAVHVVFFLIEKSRKLIKL
jgi:hypothetical protein